MSGTNRSQPRDRRVYCTLRRTYSTQALRLMGFTASGSFMVRRGACRQELARATSLDGQNWRVTPLVRHWRPGGRA